MLGTHDCRMPFLANYLSTHLYDVGMQVLVIELGVGGVGRVAGRK